MLAFISDLIRHKDNNILYVKVKDYLMAGILYSFDIVIWRHGGGGGGLKLRKGRNHPPDLCFAALVCSALTCMVLAFLLVCVFCFAMCSAQMYPSLDVHHDDDDFVGVSELSSRIVRAKNCFSCGWLLLFHYHNAVFLLSTFRLLRKILKTVM